MNGIIGLVQFDGQVPPDFDLRRMAEGTAGREADRPRIGVAAGARFGCFSQTPGDRDAPSLLAPGELFVAAGRLDNRADLANALGLPLRSRAKVSDVELMARCFERWGQQCPDRLLGDWSFAVWNPDRRCLFLARDQFGNTALYHAREGNRLAFASDIKALLALPWVPRRLNELALARLLVRRPEAGSSETTYRDINTLPPGSTLTAQRDVGKVARYWRPEETPELSLSRESDYGEVLRDTLRVAVGCRLSDSSSNGATLSGGLDSTSVALIAASELARDGRQLTALTAIPEPGLSTVITRRIVDERTTAAAAAGSAFNIRHFFVDAAGVGPVEGIRRVQAVLREPQHAAANFYWLSEVLVRAQRLGIDVLLTGQNGNQALSWAGPAEQPSVLRRKMPARVRRSLRRLGNATVQRYRQRPYWSDWQLGESRWRSFSPIRTAFANELALESVLSAEDSLPPWRRDPRQFRMAQILAQTRTLGSLWHQLGSAHRLSVRDPTQDARLVSLSFSFPAHIWKRGPGRWPLREAMKGILPDDLRLGTRRGLQAADLVARLARHRRELDDALDEMAASPLARHCIDLAYCRKVAARMTVEPPDRMLYSAAGQVLMRGVSAGLFLAELDRPGRVGRDA